MPPSAGMRRRRAIGGGPSPLWAFPIQYLGPPMKPILYGLMEEEVINA